MALESFFKANFYLYVDFYSVLRDFCPIPGGSEKVKFWGGPFFWSNIMGKTTLGCNILPPNEFFGETGPPFDVER